MLRTDFPLAPLQHRMLDYLHDTPRAKLFATMGSRKTQTVLCHVETHARLKRVLIICLKDNIKTWADEMEKWLRVPSFTMVRGTASRKRKLVDEYLESDSTYLIMGYDTAKPSTLYKDGSVKRDANGVALKSSKMERFLRKRAEAFDLIVFDESCEISNHKNARFRSLKKLARDIPYRIIMDGDPTAEGVDKLFAQFLMADDGDTFGTRYWDFKTEYYEDVGAVYPDWQLKPGAIDKMGRLLKDVAFIVTESDLREEIGLPDTTHKVLYPDMTAEQAMHYKRMKKDFETTIETVGVQVDYVMDQIHKLRGILGGFIKTKDGIKRLLGVKERVIRKLVTKHHKSQIVFWCAYTEEIDIVYDILQSMGRTPAKYHGGLNDKQKDNAKEWFNKGQHTDIVCQGGCGVGLNEFVVADTVIYYSNVNSRRKRSQSIKRVVRPTQKSPLVRIYDIVIPETWDESIHSTLMDKGAVSDKVLNWKEWKQW